MADILIAAIARICDEAELEKCLSRCVGLETSRINVFTKEHLSEKALRTRMHFIPAHGSPVSSGSHGTNVPGMGNKAMLSSYFMERDYADHLTNLGIGRDAAHHYNIAIDEGRSVVTYVASPENATSAEEQFRACGFVKIRRFSLAELPPAAEKTAVA